MGVMVLSEMDAIKAKIQARLMEMNIQQQAEEKALAFSPNGGNQEMRVQLAMKWDRLRQGYLQQMGIELQKAEQRWSEAEDARILNPGIWHTADGKPVTRKTFAP